MTVAEKGRLGGTDVPVTAFAFGAAPIGNFRYSVSHTEAQQLVHAAWEHGIRYFDTAPSYGNGLSEHRLGHALYEYPRGELTISTKVGYVLEPRRGRRQDSGLWVDPAPFNTRFDYSYDGIMRCVESSLDRLLVDTIDIAFIHDTDRYTHGDHQAEMFKQAVDEGFPALAELRSQGVVRAIGFGVNEAEVCVAAANSTEPDCFLLAGRYTLLEQDPLDDLMPICDERQIGIVLGGVYNSGILATGPIESAHFNYGPAPAEVRERAARLEKVCQRHGVPLPAAALQFAYAHPAVASICIGSRNPSQLARSVELFHTPIPADLWEELRREGLLRADAPIPEESG